MSMRPCRRNGCRDGRFRRRRVRHVERDGVGLAAGRSDRVDRSLRVVSTGRSHDHGATRRETHRDRPADAPGCAGHEGDAASQVRS